VEAPPAPETAPRRWPAAAGWAGLALVTLLAAGGAAARPGGAWQGRPTLACAAVAVCAVLALRAACGAEAGRAAASLAFVAAAVLAALPLPGVRALSGPPLLAVAGAAAVLVLARTRRAPPSWCFLPLVLLVYGTVAVRVQRQVGPEGDEPHYLMVAESLLRDHDLALERDYAEGRYRAFHEGPLEPHYRVRGARGEILSLHGLGLSLLVLPAWALGGYAGVSFFMALLAALLAREIRQLAREWIGDGAAAEGCGWLVALSPPLLHYAGLVFTEVPAALVAALALRLGRRPLSRGRAAAVALGIAFLPWLHVRYAALAAVLLAFLLFARPRRTVLLPAVAATVASAVLLMAYHSALYGFLDPRRVWGRRPELSLALLPAGLQGLLLDQEFGLLVYAPVFVLAGPGLVVLWRRSRRAAAAVVGIVAVALLTAGAWPMWRGGFNPPARFLVPALPALALGVAAVLRRGTSASTALLAGWSLWTGLAGAWQPRLVHRDRDGTAPLFRAFSGAEEWTRLLPGYVLDESAADRGKLAAVWGIALLAAAAAARGRGTAPGLGASVAGLAAAAAAASMLSGARTGGRDAVRVVGRPALEVPGWRGQAASVATWGPEALAWGPAFEPHRHPVGAEVGSRLALPAGWYAVRLDADMLPGATPSGLRIQPEGPRPPPPARLAALSPAAGGLEAGFEVRDGETAVTLRLEGGPLVLRRIHLAAQPSPAGAGPKGAGGIAAAGLTLLEPR
jgi:hypothetical protein